MGDADIDGGGRGVELVLAVFRDLTASEIADEQRSVLQRLFRHNLRNDLTVVRGNAADIAAERSTSPTEAAGRIVSAADRLIQLAEHVGRLDADGTVHSFDVTVVVESAVTEARERYPDATITLDAPAEARAQTVSGIEAAFVEALENAVVHTDDPSPEVAVSVEESDDVVEVQFADSGPGIPATEWEPVAGQRERPLRHASGLGLWMMHWAASRSGGTLTKADRSPRGTELTFALPQTAERESDEAASRADAEAE